MNSRSFDVASKDLSDLFRKFAEFLRSKEILEKMRRYPSAFRRIYKFPFYDVLLYLIFRSERCTSSEVSSYYGAIGKKELRVSKQAVFKAIGKVRWQVFPLLIRKLSELFYRSRCIKTFKGFILLAEDGTNNEICPTKEAVERFGYVANQSIHNVKDAKKATSRSSALYDVTNGLIVDFSLEPFIKAEIPMAVEHLEHCHDFLSQRKAIYLADRNYASVELFSILEDYGFNYCIRGKPNFFKKQLKETNGDDEWISVSVDKAWYKRLKYEQPRIRFSSDPLIKIRVIRHDYRYTDKNGVEQNAQLIYYTNLPEEEFSKEEIVSLYRKRWDIEVSYKTLKTDQEWERFFSKDCDSELCAIYSKIIFHNLTGIIRKQLDEVLAEEDDEDHKYTYRANINQLSKMAREFGLCRYLRSGNHKSLCKIIRLIFELRNKIKVPVRPDRHFQRWGRVVMTSAPMRFRLDGRNWPRVIQKKGHLYTIRP